MTIEEKIKEAMARYIERIKQISGITVTGWDEEFNTYSYGGCDTCGPEFDTEYRVDIWYKTVGDLYKGTSQRYTYGGKFTDLIKELDS